MTQHQLEIILTAIRPADGSIITAARKRQDSLSKPPRSLGALEDYAVRLAGITETLCPRLERCRIIVPAADNGIVAEGISSAPQSVTAVQCINMIRRKTGMSALADYWHDDVTVVDVGVAVDLPAPILNRKIRYGTENLLHGDAMTRQEALDALAVGLDLAKAAKSDGIDVVGVGEMGIGNTTTSTLVLAALTGLDPTSLTGKGGGLTEDGFARKKQVIARAMELRKPDGGDVIDVLHKVGGLDLAAMTGVFLGCAANRLPAVVDGYISIVAALCAARLCPTVTDYLFLSHVSCEVGYKAAAEALGLAPCLDLQMRLGEGSGCPLMFRILQSACAAHENMATFSEAAICDDYLTDVRKELL